MLALIAVVGILSMLLLVTVSMAYVMLPRGRMCPRCGGSTSPVVLQRLFRVLARWVQWRWCSRCAWEGPGRKGPELGPLDPPANHDSGFRWGHPDLDGVPVFYWRDESEVTDTPANPPVHPSGFQWGDDPRSKEDRRTGERRGRGKSGLPTGFQFRATGDVRPDGFKWGSDAATPDSRAPSGPTSRKPWYMAWFAPTKQVEGFQWRSPGR